VSSEASACRFANDRDQLARHGLRGEEMRAFVLVDSGCVCTPLSSFSLLRQWSMPLESPHKTLPPPPVCGNSSIPAGRSWARWWWLAVGSDDCAGAASQRGLSPCCKPRPASCLLLLLLIHPLLPPQLLVRAYQKLLCLGPALLNA
jgi:hypothetical protein